MPPDSEAEILTRAEAEEQVLLAIRRAALLHAALAEVLTEELGREAGREMVERVIERYGTWIGRAVRRRTEATELEPSPANYREDLPALGFTTEPLAEEPYRVRIHHCPLAEVWREMGLEELGALYCGVDQAKYRAYNPDLTCRHEVHCLKDGTPYCELVVEREG